MRPNKLELENFGPYRNKARIDFAVLGEFFLICGKTGSGKSTIFDAITYALFGVAPGARSGHEAELVSDFAAPGEKPFVAFEFLLSGVKYKAERIAPYSRPKRGGGIVEIKPEAALFVEHDDRWETLVSGVRDTTTAIEKLIGLSADEFSRIILLPQGEFQRFLEMESSKRSEVLEKIFPVAIYDRIAEIAKEKVRRAQSELESMNAEIQRLDEEAGENPEARISAMRNDLETAIGEEKRTAVEAASLEESSRREKERAHRVARAQEALAKKKELEIRRDSEHTREKRIKNAREAALILPVIRSFELAREKMAEVEERGKGLAGKILGLEMEKQEVERWRERAAGCACSVIDLEKELFSLEKAADAWKRRLDASEREAIAKSRAENVRKEIAANSEKVASIRAEVEKMRPATDEAPLARAVLDTLLAKAARAALQSEKLARGVSLLADLKKSDRARAESELALAAARAATEEAELWLSGLERKAALFEAAHLAAGLVSGEPCPVCGSREHPVPATTGGESGGTRASLFEELEKARRERLFDESRVAAARANLDNTEARRKELRNSLELLVQEIDPAFVAEFSLTLPDSFDTEERTSDLRASHEKVTLTRRNLEAEILGCRANLGSIEARIRLADAAAADGAKAIAKLSDEIEALKKKEEKYSAEFVEAATVAAEASRDVGTEDPLPARDAAIARKKSLEEEKIKLETVIAEWGKTYQTTLARLEAARGEEQKAKAALDQEHARLVEAISSSGIFSAQVSSDAELTAAAKASPVGLEQAIAIIRAAALPPETLAEEENAAALFREALTAATMLAQTLSADLPAEGEALPDTESLEAALALARAAQSAARTRTDTLRLSLSRLDDILARRSALTLRRDGFSANTSTLNTLAALLNGDISGKRLPFKHFVLAMYFRDVVRRASIHLSRMSDGRYYLKPEDWQSAGRAKIGLGLRVLDSWTGLDRPTATLSGGEKFLTSISLALGLADSIRDRNGGVSLDSIFIDEGFGSLDDESLDRAITILDRIRGSRTIGIISHVPGLRTRIPAVIEVEKTAFGSKIQSKMVSDQAL
jgi:exonuclease SbcC